MGFTSNFPIFQPEKQKNATDAQGLQAVNHCATKESGLRWENDEKTERNSTIIIDTLTAQALI